MKRIQKVPVSLKIAIFIILFSTGFTIAAFAQYSRSERRMEESGEKTLSPYFVVISEHPETDRLPLKETSANVNIVGVIADVTVMQKYVNSGKNTLEAIYTFPLSTKAAVYAMKMTIGKRTITARISEKEKARRDYNAAKQNGNRVSLLEQNRPNVFTMNVANISINDTIVVELKYTELLVPEKGVYTFDYPTVVGPRYSNKTKSEGGNDGQFVSTPYTKEGELPTYKFNIGVKINSSIPIQNVICTTHKTIVTHPDLYTSSIKLDKNESNGGNRDVILNYSLQGNKIESGVMLYEHGDENFFLMMVQPPKKVLEDEIPPREYIFIVDVSGSMHGYPLDISKKLLRNLILNLRPTDKFNVVLFSGYTGVLSERSVEANQINIDRAIYLIDNQRGGGGTELLGALRRAYNIPRDNSYVSRSIVLVTDGYVDVEKEAFEMVRNNNDKSNFFSFGIGSSVNRHLLEGMAFMGNGEPMIVNNKDIADQQAEKFRCYINSPVLTQIKTDFDAMEVYDIEPGTTPDMLAERPIIIFGKYKGAHNGTVTLKGNTGQSSYEKSFDLSAINPNPAFSAIRYLWARERIKLLDYYTDQRQYHQAPIDEFLKKDIIALGLKYGLMSQYTSFIAIDEEFKIDKDGKSVTVKQPLPLPQGVSDYAVGETVSVGYGSSNQVVQGRMAGVNVSTVKGNDEKGVDIADIKQRVTQVEEERIYQTVEQMPQFPGGESALMSSISKNLTYPPVAQENGIQGKVILRFKVEADGSISNITVVRSLDPACDKEAIRLVKLLPKFIPAKQNGINVAVWYTLPIAFKLE